MKNIKTKNEGENMKIQFKITGFGRIYTDKFGRVWQMLKNNYWGWNLYCFNNEDDFQNSDFISYEAWVDGGYTIQSAKRFMERNINREGISGKNPVFKGVA